MRLFTTGNSKLGKTVVAKLSSAKAQKNKVQTVHDIAWNAFP